MPITHSAKERRPLSAQQKRLQLGRSWKSTLRCHPPTHPSFPRSSPSAHRNKPSLSPHWMPEIQALL